ncbi:hypothetical protein L873DRAFT_1568608, partial [Choiromyces venosus 120613-1]
YILLTKFLTSKGLIISVLDPYIFIHIKYNIYISVYIDNITIHLTDSQYMTSLIEDLKIAFEITDLGEASFLLSLHIK